MTSGDGARVAFLFPGQGAQYPGMGAGLYRSEPVFAEALDDCARILTPVIGRDLLEVVFPDADDPQAAAEELGQAAIAQPATFAVEYALARLWMSWGVRPSVMVGHSLGEFVAACLGGVFDLGDALRLVAARGRLMQGLSGGGMLAIMLEPDAVVPLLDAQDVTCRHQCAHAVRRLGPGRIDRPARTAARRRRGGGRPASHRAGRPLADDGPHRRRVPRARARHLAARSRCR